MVTHQSIEKDVPSVDKLQTWANDPDAARMNLELIIAAIQCDQEEQVNWATEALENMGQPNPNDIPWLGAMTSNSSQDVVYWAVTLLGRCEKSIDVVQDQLASVVTASNATATIRRRAMKALGKVVKRSKFTESVIQVASNADDAQLANHAQEIL